MKYGYTTGLRVAPTNDSAESGLGFKIGCRLLWHWFFTCFIMKADNNKQHPVDKTVTPEPPQVMNPSEPPLNKKENKPSQKNRAGKSRAKEEKRGNEEPKKKLLGESETEVTGETTV